MEESYDICSDCGRAFKLGELFQRYVTKRLKVLVCEGCYQLGEDWKKEKQKKVKSGGNDEHI